MAVSAKRLDMMLKSIPSMGLSDTMMLVRFDPQSQRIVVFGIPRDTKIERPKYGIEKINAVDHESGVTAAAQEVSKVLQGVPIDRYVRVNNIGVNKLIDALGGVTVSIPKDLKYQDDAQHFYVNLKAGKQHLDGVRFDEFSLRYRHDANGDIGRMQRQTSSHASINRASSQSSKCGEDSRTVIDRSISHRY